MRCDRRARRSRPTLLDGMPTSCASTIVGAHSLSGEEPERAIHVQLEALESAGRRWSSRNIPDKRRAAVWEGIVVSEEAARASTFKQLGLATRARDILAKAYAINPRVADGGAAMSLGVLYYKVPGWPVGFGSTTKARAYSRRRCARPERPGQQFLLWRLPGSGRR